MIEKQTLFTRGEGGYHTYRIPAILTAKTGTLLAVCEGRRDSGSDTGNIDLLLRRSEDQGTTWSEAIEITASTKQSEWTWYATGPGAGLAIERGPHKGRRNMTLRASFDEAETWPVALVLHSGLAAYSDLAVAPDGTICCLYECGAEERYSEQIVLARIQPEALGI